MQSQFALLARRRFLPLFATQFLGAFNDNVLKNALVILITYRIAAAAGIDAPTLVNLAGGIFILPFFLFSATAGQLADKLEKSLLVRIIKTVEIGIMGVATWGLFADSLGLLLVALFLMGTHSAFFGPLKYGILPDHLRRDELISGNALIDAGTFLAILLGTILGGILILSEDGSLFTSAAMLAVAVAGLAASLSIPKAGPAAPDLTVNPNPAAESIRIIRQAGRERSVRLSLIGISWFWAVGATFLAQFPPYARDVVGAGEHVVTLFLTTFSVGVGLGSLLCNLALKGEISARYVPLAALGMTVFSFDLYLASPNGAAAGGALVGVGQFLASAGHWRILLDMLMVSAFGGFYAVPLYAILQSRAEEGFCSRAIAANNIVNAAAMVVSAVALAFAFNLGLVTVTGVFLVLAAGNGLVALWSHRLIREARR